MTAYERVLDALGDAVTRRNGVQAQARCPAHEDRAPSLSLRAIEGQALLHCHAGCHTEDVLAAVGMTMRDLFDEKAGAAYKYDDGRVVHRTPDKRFRQTGNTKGHPSLYRLNKVIEAVANKTAVHVVEGEKDVHALESLGAVATTAPMGAANFAKVDVAPLAGAHVIVVPDRDHAGQTWLAQVRQLLDPIAASVMVKTAMAGKDAAGHIAAGHGIDELLEAEPSTEDGAAELNESGAGLLDDVRAAVARYCILPSPETVDAVVLWVAATHSLPAFDYAPRLVIRSAEKRSGKSRLLEVLAVLCHHPPLRVVNASVSFIFRSLGGEHPPVLLLDEADTLFGSKAKAEQYEDLRGLINAGFQRGLTYGRTVGPTHTPVEFETFAMCATASIGRMPDTIEDRAVVVQMRRRKPSETVQPYRRRRDEPGLVELRDRLATWSLGQLDALQEAMPELPVEDRAADTWEPLVAVADAAGGAWPARARRAAVTMTTEAEEHDSEASLNVRLLADIRDVFTDMTVSFLPSKELCVRLCQVEDAPWRDFDLNPSKLGRRLSDYDIRTQRNTAGTARGYRLEDFIDAFERYLPATDPSDGVRSRPQAVDQQKQPDTLNPPDTLKASGAQRASEQTRRSGPVLTPLTASDAIPPETEADCPVCTWPLDSEGHASNCERTPA